MRTYVTNTLSQTPPENRPASIDWVNQLPIGVNVSSVEMLSDSTDYTISDITFSEQVVTFWLTGGVSGKQYNITCQISSTDGETLQATVPFICTQFNYVGVQFGKRCC